MNFFKTMLITLGVLVMAWSCTSPLDNVNSVPTGETVYGEGEGGLVLSLNPTAPSGSSRYTGNDYTLANVSLVTVQLTHEVTKAIKFASATASGGTVTVKFDRLPTGTWDLKANLYDNSTTPPDLLYWSFDKVQIKPRTTATKTLLAIPTGSLDGTWQELPTLTGISVTDAAAGTSGSIPATAPFQLFATLNPVNYPYPKVDWFSSDPKVASVDPFGVVTTYRPGTVTITAKAGMLVGDEVSASYTLTVLEPFIGDWRGKTDSYMYEASVREANYDEIFWIIRPDGTWLHVDTSANDDIAYRGTWTAGGGNLIFHTTELFEVSTGTWSSAEVEIEESITSWYFEKDGDLVISSTASTVPEGLRRFKYTPATSIIPSGNFTPGTSLDINYVNSASDDALIMGARANPEATFQQTLWVSSNPGIVQISERGALVVKSTGTVTVRAITPDGSAQAAMTVNITDGTSIPALTDLAILPTSNGNFTLSFLPNQNTVRVEYSEDSGSTWYSQAEDFSTSSFFLPAGKNLLVRASPGTDNNYNYFAVPTKGLTLTVYTPVYNNNSYIPQILSVAQGNDPDGNRTFTHVVVDPPSSETYTAQFYTDNTGTALATNDFQLKIGADTFWIYTGNATFPYEMQIVRYRTQFVGGTLVTTTLGSYSTDFPTGDAKIWKVAPGLSYDNIDFFGPAETIGLSWNTLYYIGNP